MLRAANTGVTCVIDNCGRVTKRVKDDKGKDVFTEGFIKASVNKQGNLSLYSRLGDIFILICSLYLLLFALRFFKKSSLRFYSPSPY